jgi:hypothetical protein
LLLLLARHIQACAAAKACRNAIRYSLPCGACIRLLVCLLRLLLLLVLVIAAAGDRSFCCAPRRW